MKAWRSCGELMEHLRDCEIIGNVGICRYSGLVGYVGKLQQLQVLQYLHSA